MGVPSLVLGLLLALAAQWLLVTANPTGAPPTGATSTAPDGAPRAGDRTATTSEEDGFTLNVDAPTTNSHIHSAGRGTSNVAQSAITDSPATSSKEQDAAGANPTTVTMDRDGATVGPTTTTSDPHPRTATSDSLAAGTGGVVAVRDGESARPSTPDTSSSTATADPITVTTVVTTEPVTHAAKPTKRRADPVCPDGCECDNLEVHCSRAGLVAFPDGLDPKTTYLDVGHNLLTAIADDELANLGLTKLTSLICDDNQIESVGRYAFRGLEDLALLQLSGNRIRHLAPFVFVGNDDLRHIDLTGNPLEIQRGPVLSIQQLEWLDLDHCNITFLSIDAFRDMRALRYINLSGNRMSYLTTDHFHGLNYLRYIKLNGNPLLCNCDMKPLYLYFRRQAINVDAKCIDPLDGSTQAWNHLEDVNCDNYDAPYPPLN